MRGRLWLNNFISVVKSERQKHPARKKWTDPEWTDFMRGVMKRVGDKMNCYVAQLSPENSELSGEYFNIDAVFIDRAEYDLIANKSKWDPFVLPCAIVELENSYDTKKISSCLWKILCVRTPIRVLICYQRNKNRVTILKQHLEDVIWQGSLMKGTDGDLLVVMGNDSTGTEASWAEYFSVFEWRNDSLQKIEGLEW